jgi:hypothetical protein
MAPQDKFIVQLGRDRLNSGGGCDSWLKIGMALKTELGDHGLSLWKYHSDLNFVCLFR